jgi:hypothetical protein
MEIAKEDRFIEPETFCNYNFLNLSPRAGKGQPNNKPEKSPAKKFIGCE